MTPYSVRERPSGKTAKNQDGGKGKNKTNQASCLAYYVAPSDIISNLFLEDLEKIWELKKWIPDPCNPHLRDLKQDDEEDKQP